MITRFKILEDSNILALEENDIVVLIGKNTNFPRFVVDKVYKIINIDHSDKNLPYEIEEIEPIASHRWGLWVRSTQIRKATQLEIDINKYNL